MVDENKKQTKKPIEISHAIKTVFFFLFVKKYYVRFTLARNVDFIIFFYPSVVQIDFGHFFMVFFFFNKHSTFGHVIFFRLRSAPVRYYCPSIGLRDCDDGTCTYRLYFRFIDDDGSQY